MRKAEIGRLRLRRSFAVFACAGMLALGLAGCASQEVQEGAPGAEAGQAPAEQESPGFADVANMDFSYSERDLDASWDEANATLVNLGSEEAVSVSEAGLFILKGELADGQVTVDAPEDAEVQLVLDGAAIHNEDGPALYVKSAGKVYVTLAEGSENLLSDGAEYALEQGEDEPNAALYSKADLCINGAGALTVEGAFEHAVNSKGALVITGGAFDITAADDALRGKDCVKIANGSFHITAGGDGIKSNNEDDHALGFVSIDGGSFAIEAADDAVKTATYYVVNDGELSISAGDDAFNSDSDGRVAGGVLSVDAGGDAFHTEFFFAMDAGEVDVISCEEGFEGQEVHVNGGTTHITSTDDAINAATGETPEEKAAAEAAEAEAAAAAEAAGEADAAAAAAPEDPMAKANEECLIRITGGYLALDAGGDAIDSNGYVEIGGGIVLAEGPTATEDATFDYDFGAKITGGTVLMLSNSGMEMGFTEATQPFGMVRVSGKAGDTVALVAQAGDVAEYGELLASYTAKRDFVTVTVSSPALTDGIEYELVVGANVPEGANADGFADGGTVTGGVAMAFVASTEAAGQGGFGGPGGPMPGGNMAPGERGEAPAMPEGTQPAAMPDGATPPEGAGFPEGEAPVPPDGADFPEGTQPPAKPDEAASA